MAGSAAVKKLTVANARRDFVKSLRRVRTRSARIPIEDAKGRTVAAMVPADDLKRLQLLEDFLDAMAAYEALSEGKTIPWEKVREELGLDD